MLFLTETTYAKIVMPSKYLTIQKSHDEFVLVYSLSGIIIHHYLLFPEC